MHTFEVVVHAKTLVADDLVAVDLRHPRSGELPAWSPGAHIDLCLPSGMTRQYSLCGDPAERSHWRLGVLREPRSRGGSRYVHDVLAAGDTVRVSAPRNHFPLVPASRYTFVAGGVGVTPLLPMVRAADRRGADWRFLYGGRNRRSMGFTAELRAYGDRVTVWPEDEAGLLDLDGLLASAEPGEQVYCCGPEPLLRAMESRCRQEPRVTLHVERFSPRQPTERQADAAFEVVLAETGTTVTVPVGTSVLQAVEAAGVPVESSCEEGTCGTCETKVLAGTPDHRDSVLTDEERETNETMMICVSRCHGPRLVLDL